MDMNGSRPELIVSGDIEDFDLDFASQTVFYIDTNTNKVITLTQKKIKINKQASLHCICSVCVEEGFNRNTCNSNPDQSILSLQYIA